MTRCYLFLGVLLFWVGNASATVPGITVTRNDLAAADTSKPGFKIRVVQADSATPLPNTIDRAEQQLAGTLTNQTGVLYTNVADTTGADANGFIDFDGVINFNVTAGESAGYFSPDQQMPGLPGQTEDPANATSNLSVEIITYLYLETGSHQFSVTSDGAVRVSAGRNPRDAFAREIVRAEGDRAVGDTVFQVTALTNGYYGFRIVYAHNIGDGALEFLTLDPDTGEPILVNDLTDAASIRAYREATNGPYVQSISPAASVSDVATNATIQVVIASAGTTIDTNSIKLSLNGQVVQPTISGDSTNAITISYTSASGFVAGSQNVALVYAVNASELATNQWSFTVGPRSSEPAVMSIAQNGGQVIVSWIGGGNLQIAPTVVGPWEDRTTVGSSTNVAPTLPYQFFRVRN